MSERMTDREVYAERMAERERLAEETAAWHDPENWPAYLPGDDPKLSGSDFNFNKEPDDGDCN